MKERSMGFPARALKITKVSPKPVDNVSPKMVEHMFNRRKKESRPVARRVAPEALRQTLRLSATVCKQSLCRHRREPPARQGKCNIRVGRKGGYGWMGMRGRTGRGENGGKG